MVGGRGEDVELGGQERVFVGRREEEGDSKITLSCSERSPTLL